MFAWKGAFGLDFICGSDCFQWSSNHRFAGMERKHIEMSRRVLKAGFVFWCLFHHGQHRVPRMLHLLGKCALACAADGVIAAKRRNDEATDGGVQHRTRKRRSASRRAPATVKGVYRMVVQAFAGQRTALRAE